MNSTIYDVDVASDVKNFLANNMDDVSFHSPSLKKSILSTDDNTLLRIGKVINSPMVIVSVDIVDSNFLKNHLFENGDAD